MAKAKSRSSKSKTGGSHRKKHGARNGIEVCPLLSAVAGYAVPTFRPGRSPAGYPTSATVSDLGFYGSPKSKRRTIGWNADMNVTGGMNFPPAERGYTVRDGKVVTGLIEHNAHIAAARKERAKERAIRRNTVERFARRVRARAEKLLEKNPDLSIPEAQAMAARQIRELLARLPMPPRS